MIGYLLLDIPSNCDKCLMCEKLFSPDRYGMYYCKKELKNISYTADREERPEWCPIKIWDENMQPKLQWHSNSIKPEIEKNVVIKDCYDKEYNNYMWNGICWMIKDKEKTIRSNYDVIAWKYQ